MNGFSDHTLRKDTKNLFSSLSQQKFLSGFFLVGGTALAMYYHHRESVDIDLFSFDEFNTDELLIEIQKNYDNVERIGQTRLSLNLLISGVKVDFINHPYPILEKPVEHSNISIASLTDIAAMKVNAVCGRGSKKDFVDVYFLIKEFSLQKLLHLFLRKYPNTSELMAVKSLAYFDDAEETVMPVMIKEVSWNQVKSKITTEVENLKNKK